MSDTKPTLSVEAGVSNDTTTSVSLDGSEKIVATTKADIGHSRELDGSDWTEIEDDEDVDGGDPSADPEAEGTPEDGDGPPEDTAEDLGEFDPEAPEKFDAAYFTDAGELNFERLTAEFDKNAAKGTEGLNEATYQYLENRLGLTKDAIKAVEAGQVALRAQETQQLYERAGGKERLEAAIAWGREGGYTEDQRARFTKAMASGDKALIADTVDALMARFERSNGKGQRLPAGKPRRPSSPERSATKGVASAPRQSGYATHAEYSAEFREARASKDPAKMKAVQDKLKRSPTILRGRG